jgi:hypothetical protein
MKNRKYATNRRRMLDGTNGVCLNSKGELASKSRSDMVESSPEVPKELMEKENDGQEEGGKDDQEEDPTNRLEKISERLAEERPHVRVHRIQNLENEAEDPLEEKSTPHEAKTPAALDGATAL